MDKKSFAIGLIGFFIFFTLSLYSFKEETKTLYLFYSAECPHCLRVLDFTVKAQFKRPIVLKEVFYNDNNYEEFLKIAKRTGVNTIKVPAIFDPRKNKLLDGEDQVLEYLKRYAKE